MSFKEGDTVKVTTKNSSHEGKIGKVVGVYEDAGTYRVQIEQPAPKGSMFDTMGVLTGFFEAELEAVLDPKHEALIKLAETLDDARKQANAIPETEDQNGVYGRIVNSLTDTLGAYFYDIGLPFPLAYDAYQTMMEDGLTVREAIEAVRQ